MSDPLSQIPQMILNRKKQQKQVSDITLDKDIFLGLDSLENIDLKFNVFSQSQRRNSFLNGDNYNRSLSMNKMQSLYTKQTIQAPDSNTTEINLQQPKESKLVNLNAINEFKQNNIKSQGRIQSSRGQHIIQQANTDKMVQGLNLGSIKNFLSDNSTQDQNQPAFLINKKRNSHSSHAACNYKSQTSLAIQANIHSNQKENSDKMSKNLFFTNEIKKQNDGLKTSSHITEQSLIQSRRRLSQKDIAAFQRNLFINRSIQALKRNLIEMNGENALNSSRYQKEQNNNNNNSQFNNLATLIFEIISSNNSIGNFMKNPFQNPIPNIEKIFNQLNIDKKKLDTFKSLEEKEEYIVTQIYIQSVEQLKQTIEKINNKTDEFAQIEEREKEKGKYKKNMNELFSWIQIPCTYEGLKNKVKYSLVEVLYGHNNLQQLQVLQQKNEEYNNNLKSMKEGMTHKYLSTLGEFQENQQLNETLNYLSSLNFSKKIRSVHLKIDDDSNKISQSLLKSEQKKLTTVSGQSNISSKFQKTDQSNHKLDQVASPKLIPNNFSDQFQNFDDQHFKDTDVILKQKLNNFEWDYKNERTFQSYKKNAKKTFVGLDSMSRWQSIGMQPIIQKLGLEEKLDLYREQLQEKYQRGEMLKESEKIFIINTSQLLISNIDKEFFQGMLDFICEEDILRLEQIIAENTILKYETIAQYLKNQRNQYLREKADEQAKKIEKPNAVSNIYNKIKEEKKTISRQKELNSNVEKIKRRLERKFESIQYYEKLRKNIYVQHFVNQLKKAIAEKELGQKKFVKEESYYHNFAKRNFPQKKEKILYNISNKEQEVPITIQKSQKIYHPSSKLLLGLNNLARVEEVQKNNRNRNYLIDMPPKQQRQLEMQRATYEQFTNRIKDSKNLESFQANFTEYYSNGPIDSRELIHKNLNQEKKKEQTDDSIKQEIKSRKPHQWITKQIQEKCAIIIQKWTRRFLQQKKFNEQKQQMKDQQEKKVFSVLKSWKDSKELMSFIKNHTLQIARQKNKTQNKNQVKNINTYQSQSQPNSPKSNASSISVNNNQNIKDKQKEKLGSNAYAKTHKKQVSEYNFNQQNQNAYQQLDRSDSISSINSKQSKHSYLGSATSTRIGGTMTHDFSIYGLHAYNATKMKSVKSTDDSIHQISHVKSTSDFQSPKSALFTSRQFFPSSAAMMSNYLGESQHNNLTMKELKQQQIDEDVNMENEQHQNDDQLKNNKLMFQKQLIEQQQKNIPIQLQRKVSFTPNQLKQQINKMKNGVKTFSKKREELLLKQKKLFYAVKQGNIQIIKNSGFIYYPHDVNAADDKGNCPLYYATKRGNEELIDFLLRTGADVNIKCQEGNTPLHLAFQLANEKVIMSFLDNGGDLNSVNQNGQTPLAFAPIKLLKLIGLDKGITNIEPSKIGQRIDFDNNRIFIETHNIIDSTNHVKETNSNITIVKKRKEKQAHEELPQKEMYFQFIPTNSTLDQNNYDKFSQGIKILQKSPKSSDMIQQIQSFVEPHSRQLNKKEETQSYLQFSPIILNE